MGPLGPFSAHRAYFCEDGAAVSRDESDIKIILFSTYGHPWVFAPSVNVPQQLFLSHFHSGKRHLPLNIRMLSKARSYLALSFLQFYSKNF